MLLDHDQMQSESDLSRTYTRKKPSIEISEDFKDIKTDNLPQVEQSPLPMEGFVIPESLGALSSVEIQDAVAPSYLEACLKMANRAMMGQVNPFKEGDLPHKMALLLAHKMLPSRKVNEKPMKETPKVNKETQRALKSIIKSLTSDSDTIEVNTLRPSQGSEVRQGQARTRQSRGSDG